MAPQIHAPPPITRDEATEDTLPYDKETLEQDEPSLALGRRELGGSGDNGYLVDAYGNAYEASSLAWRYLGVFIDNNCNNRRRLEDGGNSCRKVLWAAYHDSGYSGHGIAEYQFYNHQDGSWDGSTCRAQTRGYWWPFTRCQKLDCHQAGTKLDLVGVFKETDGLYDWTEQLFKHQGYCLWDEDKNSDGSGDSRDGGSADNAYNDDVSYVYNKYSDYNFMTSVSENWVDGCTQLDNAVDDDGSYLYYDTKPLPGGDITYGVYTDANCLTESSYTWADLRANAENNGDSWMTSDAAFARWNALLSDYKICQPCRAYNRIQDNQEGSHDSGDNSEDNSEDYEDGDDGEGGKDRWGFNCYDAAGYLNCNQCYKFQSQTDMEAASYDDLAAATQQGTILAITVDGTTYGKGYYRAPGRAREVLKRTSAVLLGFSGLAVLVWAYCWCNRKPSRRVGNTTGLKDKLNPSFEDETPKFSRFAVMGHLLSQYNPFASFSAPTTHDAPTGVGMVPTHIVEHEKKVLKAQLRERDIELAKQKKMLAVQLQERDVELAKQEKVIQQLLQTIEYYKTKDTNTLHESFESYESSTNVDTSIESQQHADQNDPAALARRAFFISR